MSRAATSPGLRVAIVNWTTRAVGGAETYIGTVVGALAERGHRFALFTDVDAPAARPMLPLPASTPRWTVATDGPAALPALRAWRPDVIFAHGMLDVELEARTAAVAPVVFFAHNYYGTCISGTKTYTRPDRRPCAETFGAGCALHYFPRRCGGWSPLTMAREYRRQSRRLDLLRTYAEVLTMSEHMRREYERHGIAARCAGGIAQPLSPDAAARIDDLVEWTSPAADAGVPRLLFVGRMDALKGGDLLLDALPAVGARLGRDARLTMVGDGPERAAWETRMRAGTTRAAAVRFVGWRGPADVRALMRLHDLLVVPSVGPEPFGLVGVEAALEGLPAVAFDVGGIPEWLQDRVGGALAPADPPSSAGLADAIVWCLESPARHASLGAGARAHARTLTVDRHVSVVEDALRRAAAQGPARS